MQAEASRTPMVLVTGSGGFIGSHLVPALTARGRSVRALTSRAGQASGINVEYRQVSRYDEPDPRWLEAVAGVDSIVHLAGRAHVMREDRTSSMARYRAANVDATVALAREAVARGVRRFVFVSSIGVNGNATSTHAFDERSVPVPLEPYAVSKWEAERALAEICAGSNTEYVVVRPPLVYGPGAKGNFQRLLQLVALGLPLPLGALTGLRSYVGVHNLCDFLARCLDHPMAAGRTFLIADGEDIATTELIRVLGAGMNRRARLFPVPFSLLRLVGRLTGQGAAIERLAGSLQVDARFAQTCLQWSAPRRLRDGLTEMARAYQEQKLVLRNVGR